MDPNLNPQKDCLKLICKLLYYLGLGDCWYEETSKTTTQKKIYATFAAIANAYAFFGILNELLANFRLDLTPNQRKDLVQFSFAHSIIYAKIIVYYLQKKRIKVVLKRLLEDNRDVLSLLELETASVRKALHFGTVLGISLYITIIFAIVEAIRVHYKEGIPIGTEITLYPTPSNSGVFVNILRVFIELHWWYIVTIMYLVDCLSFCSLIFLSYKFKFLQNYFESLKKKIYRRHQDDSGQGFREDFIVGIKLHEDSLWCARHVQYALGNLYSIQIFESIALIVMCLVKLVSMERNLTTLLANLTYISCLLVLTGVYMFTAGDITYEAAQVSTSIFHSGWEAIHDSHNVRVFAVVAIQRSQVPVYMTAFGIIPLSYSNFISVVRSSYSFFAVMY